MCVVCVVCVGMYLLTSGSLFSVSLISGVSLRVAMHTVHMHTNIHIDTHLQVADKDSIGGLKASVPMYTDLSCRSYVTYSAISNYLKSQELAVLD